MIALKSAPTGPSVVIVDKGMARNVSTDTLRSGIYAFTFDQQGLMGDLGLQGSKIMRVDQATNFFLGFGLRRQ
jgi:hypothetical protein